MILQQQKPTLPIHGVSTSVFLGKFIRNKKYYTGEVYEWNLPTGITCPFANECKVTVDRATGKFDIKKGYFRCYAASSERFPAVREHRWKNFEYVKGGGVPQLPKDCKNVRIHASGDFYSQQYFDMWLQVAIDNPNINFWAFTKSINYWIVNIDKIPDNFVLTASYGGYHDCYIEQFGLKNCKVYTNISEVPENMPIDTNDDWARKSNISFALLDNNKISKKKPILNERTLF
jgi:hypothetical protein